MTKDKQGRKNIPIHKRGDVKDGLFFWGYAHDCKNGEYWLSEDVFKAKRISKQIYYKKYMERNRDKLLTYQTEYNKVNREKRKEWFKDNRDTRRVYSNKLHTARKKIDPSYKMSCVLRSRTWRLLKLANVRKTQCFNQMIGCTPLELRHHIEKQFAKGMSWENHGKKGWHLDHIRPCCAFDLSDERQQFECFNYKNLQPLWAVDNLTKSGIWNTNTMKSL